MERGESTMNDKREYRSMEYRIESENNENYMVKGYASTFEKYLLFSQDGVDYFEQIEPTAFDEADMTDVVFRVDHEGAVYARTSNGSISLFVDEHGLGQETDLGRTAKARDLYDDIRAGMYPKMSFAFVVSDDEYDKNTHTRTIKKIAKVFDVSPVSFPANPTTELDVKTRDYFNGVIEMERAERLANEQRAREKARLELKIKIMESEK